MQKANNEIELQLRCQRCFGIDLEALLRTDNTSSPSNVKSTQDNNRFDREMTYVSLGPLCSLELDPQCPLCTLLDHLRPPISPYPHQDVYLIPARTLSYLEPTISHVKYEIGRKYANLLYLGQEIIENGTRRLPYVHEAHNAVGRAVDKDINEMMLVRKVNPSRFNVNLAKAWLESCQKHHGRNCRNGNVDIKELDCIRLIDTKLRRVVLYKTASSASDTTTGTVDYLCLSYVWGGVNQPTITLGSKLDNLPAVIRDAMEVVRLLGKRYLWVDSVS